MEKWMSQLPMLNGVKMEVIVITSCITEENIKFSHIHPFFCLFVSFHSNFCTTTSLTLIFCMYMGHDYNSPEILKIKVSSSMSRVRVNKDGNVVGLTSILN